MSFPDWNSLRRFFSKRVPWDGREGEDSYRERCAKFSEEEGDPIQAAEVRLGKAWDEWSSRDKAKYLNSQGVISKMLADSIQEQIADYESQLAQVREDHRGRKKPVLYDPIVVGLYLGILEGLHKDLLNLEKERGA